MDSHGESAASASCGEAEHSGRLDVELHNSAPASSPASDANALTTVTVDEIQWVLSFTLIHEDTEIRPASLSYVKPSEYKQRVEYLLARCRDRIADLERQRASDAREIAALRERLASYDALARDLAANWDHDSDAHKYGTSCRVCMAEAALAPASPTCPEV